MKQFYLQGCCVSALLTSDEMASNHWLDWITFNCYVFRNYISIWLSYPPDQAVYKNTAQPEY